MNKHTIASYLIIASKQEATEYAQQFIKKYLCVAHCTGCTVCKRISERQHHQLLWITPERSYTRELLEPVFHRLSFAGNKDNPLFIVFDDAEFLTPSVGNSLLKSLEEPPVGYIFLLLARAQEFVLPTIVSRCVLQFAGPNDSNNSFRTLIDIYSKPESVSYMRVAKELDEIAKQERYAPVILETIYKNWVKELCESLHEGNAKRVLRAQKACALLEKSMKTVPMPGSARFFYRTLFMQLKNYLA